jgi:hypothetical protein
MQKRIISLTFLLLLQCLSLACAVPRTARLYDLDKGIVMEAYVADARQSHGKITAVNPVSGETFTGEYTSVANDVIRSSYGMGGSNVSGYATSGASSLSYSGYGWATAYGFSFDQPTASYGAATLVGNEGTVIEIVYQVDRRTQHGYGVGRDNQGGRYKLHF